MKKPTFTLLRGNIFSNSNCQFENKTGILRRKLHYIDIQLAYLSARERNKPMGTMGTCRLSISLHTCFRNTKEHARWPCTYLLFMSEQSVLLRHPESIVAATQLVPSDEERYLKSWELITQMKRKSTQTFTTAQELVLECVCQVSLTNTMWWVVELYGSPFTLVMLWICLFPHTRSNTFQMGFFVPIQNQ